MNIAAIQQRLRDFAADRDWQQFHTPKNLAMALSVEASELLEIFQWLTEDQSESLGVATGQAAADEMADVAIYLLRMADVIGIDLERAIDDKIEINAAKYPVATSKGNAIKYSRR